jgi:hypothetical protein
MYAYYSKKGDNIEHYNENHKIGFSISNFINTLNHDNKMLKEKIDLYLNYVSFFHIAQKKQLKRLSLRINEFYKEVDENININRTFSINDINDEQRLNRFYMTETGGELAIDSIYEDTDILKAKPIKTAIIPTFDPSYNHNSSQSSAAATAPAPQNSLPVFEFPTLVLKPLGNKPATDSAITTAPALMNSEFAGIQIQVEDPITGTDAPIV